MWNLLLRCLAARPRRPLDLGLELPLPEQADERPLGCGWFDSSHELAQGVRVTEVDEAAAPLWQWVAQTQA
jgi:hypothetical protein